MLHYYYVIVLTFILNNNYCSLLVAANPVHYELVEARANVDNNEDDSNTSSLLSPRAWVPVVVVVLVLCIVALMTWSKDSLLKVVKVFKIFGSSNTAAAQSDTGATATRQLTTEELVGSTADLQDAARRPRRSRRPRRTPSQMSVTSLPAYNKEPGEEELVIYRARDPEEEAMLGSRATLHAEDDNRYEGDLSLQRSDNLGVPSEEAPAYFEAVDEPSSTKTGRLRSLLTMMSPKHRRGESAASLISHSRTSSSSISFLRPTSDQNSRLNSPSLISLNPISAPLSHTLIRTEFTYPKSGPTPEQLKVISSRDNFSRFGLPYGPDAIAFAASSSRQDLDPPPPHFEPSSSSSQPESTNSTISSSSSSNTTSPPALPSSTISSSSSSNITTTPPTLPSSTISSSSSSSNTTTTSPPTLPSINVVSDFGNLYTPTTTTPHSDSTTSKYSIQSYATAPESLPPRENYPDSRSSTPRLGDH